MYIAAEFSMTMNGITVSHTAQVEANTPLENMAHVVAGFTGKSGIWFAETEDPHHFETLSGSEKIGCVRFASPIYLAPSIFFL